MKSDSLMTRILVVSCRECAATVSMIFLKLFFVAIVVCDCTDINKRDAAALDNQRALRRGKSLATGSPRRCRPVVVGGEERSRFLHFSFVS